MRVLVATPCALGMVHNQYLLSFIETYNWAMKHRQEIAQQLITQAQGRNDPEVVQAIQNTMHRHTYEIGLYTMAGESLLPRARNHCAQVCLTQGWDKLFFIDADTHWTAQDFKAVLEANLPLIGGVVPLKTYVDFPRSFKTSLNYLPFLEDEKYFDRSLRTLESTVKMAQGHANAIVKVAFTGTAFLCIDRSVLLKMAETASEYLYPSPTTGQVETHWSFFDGGPLENIYLSEDWSFVHKARELGFDCHINTNVRLGHVGNHHFVAG